MLTASVLLALSVLLMSTPSKVVSFNSITCATVVDVSGSYGEEGCVKVNETGAFFRCGSLQAGLDFASRVQQAENCTEIILLSGEVFSILQSVTINSSLVLRSSDPQLRARVTVSAERKPKPPDYPPFYVLTLSDAKLVVIESVDFSRSSTGIISILDVDEVLVSNSAFSNFSEGALDIYNCPVVTVIDCAFEDNGPVAYTLKPEPYRSHSGGLSIGCHNLTLGDSPASVTIQNTIFRNNSALPSKEIIQTTSQIFSGTLFTGRGGALGLKLSESRVSITAKVEDCVFVENAASSFGGGAYVLFGNLSAHVVTVRNCMFAQNWCGFGGGGLLGVFFGAGFNNSFSFINVTGCVFEQNRSVQGAGSYITLPGTAGHDVETNWNYVRFEHCIFESNVATAYAAAIAISNPEIFRYRSQDKSFEIASCTFLKNVHRESTTLGAVFVPLSFEGHNIFDQSTGSAIQLAGSLVTLSGRLDITNSDLIGTNNGALQFVSFSQLRMLKGSEIHFENNRGTIGASLTVETLDSYETLERLQYNPLCFLLYQEQFLAPDQWTDVDIYFENNKALVGAVGFLTSLDTCSWVQTHEPFFDNARVLNWSFVHFGENTNLFHEKSPQNPLWFTQTNVYSIGIKNTTVQIYPGEKVHLELEVLDELDHPVGSVIRLTPMETSNLNGMNLTFTPSVELYGHVSQTFNTTLHVGSNEIHNSTLYHTTSNTIVVDNYLQQTSNEDTFEVYQESCPEGYVLSNVHQVKKDFECVCNTNNSNILACDEGEVIFKKRLWASSDFSTENHLFVLPCPPGYCQCKVTSITGESACLYYYDSADPNKQCSCQRSGVLCGKCNNGSGFSALVNTCDTCSDSSAFIIPLLVFVDIALLIVIIIKLNRPFPDWLYPCLFFIQFLPPATESIPFGFEIIRRYQLFVASGLSFYLPYDFCLYNGATAVVTYLLKFIPLLVDILVFPSTLFIISRWSFLKRRFAKPWYSVWFVFVLQYTHFVHSATSILHCVKIPLNGSTELRWFVDGEVQCFTGYHLPLAILALVVLVLCAALIPLTGALLLDKKMKRKLWFQTTAELLRAGFKPSCQWWFPVELSRRFLLVIMAVLSPGSIYPVLFSVCIIATVFSYVQPYKSRLANCIDSLLWVNTIAFFLVTVPEAFQTFEPYNATDPISGCTGEDSSIYIFTTAIYVMFVVYYLPLIITVGIIITVITMIILRKWRTRGIKLRPHGSISSEVEAPYWRFRRGLFPQTTVTYELDDMDNLDENLSIQAGIDQSIAGHSGIFAPFLVNLKRTKSS